MITVTVNGKPFETPSGANVHGLLEALGLPQQGTLVERNGVALFARDFGSTPVAEDDRFEVVRIAAGG
jgi:thiamine biosynthesis protein ThiS